MRMLRNIFRRKLRAFLTIFGIAIGVFALVVMGSIAEKLTLLVDGGVKYYEGKVVIVPKVEGATSSSSLLSIDLQRDIERVHGVRAVSADISARLTTETITVSFGPPAAVSGSDGKGDSYEKFKLTYSDGRALHPWENGKVAVGSDLVDKLGAKVGGTVKIRDKYYEVVGILEKTLTELGMPKEIVMRHRPPQFAHVFAGDGYSAGYYSYLWADTLSSDAFEAFTGAKGPYDPAVARRLREHVFSAGNTVDPAEAYRAFRGADPGIGALMRERGFPAPAAR